MRIDFHGGIHQEPASSGCGEGGIPLAHHPVSFKNGEEMGLQEYVMTQAQNPASRKRLYGKCLVGSAVVAAPRTVTSAERSTWTLFLRVFLPFP